MSLKLLQWNLAFPNDINWLVLKFFTTSSFEDQRYLTRMPLITRAINIAQSSNHQLLPKLLVLRGSSCCFAQQFDKALADFHCAFNLLQNDSSASIIPEIKSFQTSHFRNCMLLEISLDIGRVQLIHQREKKAADSADRIRKYLDGVPHDSSYFIEAHYELFEATFYDDYDLDAGESIISRADAAEKLRIPILSPLTDESFPKRAQAKNHLNMLQLMKKRDPRRFEEKMHDQKAKSKCVQQLKCWRCSVLESSKLNLLWCSGCHLARYCSADCQRKHWAQHKTQCRSISKKT